MVKNIYETGEIKKRICKRKFVDSLKLKNDTFNTENTANFMIQFSKHEMIQILYMKYNLHAILQVSTLP
jgi:hypothetical protein